MHDFEFIDVGVRAGPTATLISFFLEYLKLPFAGVFGKTLYAAAGWALWPLRYLGLWLNTRPRTRTRACRLHPGEKACAGKGYDFGGLTVHASC
jgi:hypothetical protein